MKYGAESDVINNRKLRISGACSSSLRTRSHFPSRRFSFGFRRPGLSRKARANSKPGELHDGGIPWLFNTLRILFPALPSAVSSIQFSQSSAITQGLLIHRVEGHHFPSVFSFLLTSDDLDLRHTMTVPQYDTNLRRRSTLLRKLANLVHNLFGRGFEPGGDGARVWDRGGRNAFASAVKTTHDGDENCLSMLSVDG